ncbi:MAG TPA: hypothetical protein VHL30_02955 [Chlamydiales bacterium]|jgi:hypothetical protein|nr:hypothetical protein [Chlamydiales bacterium]
MNYFKYIATFILLCLAINGTTQEAPPLLPLEEQSLTYEKNFLYGSLSIVPGGGVSHRKRDLSQGTAVDFKVGAFPFTFDSTVWIPVLSADYNWISYSREKEIAPYFSYGVGAAYILPYVPLRAGIEFKSGFIDVGAKMLFPILVGVTEFPVVPSPEVRGGIAFDF